MRRHEPTVTDEQVDLDRLQFGVSDVQLHGVTRQEHVTLEVHVLVALVLVQRIFHGELVQAELVGEQLQIAASRRVDVDPQHGRRLFQQLGDVLQLVADLRLGATTVEVRGAVAHRIGEATSMEVTILKGDIVEQEVDAVVNAANSGLMGGGGVDGAILRAGGAAQRDARRRLVERIGSLPTGQAAASEAGALPARWVIHVVGPVHSKSEDRTELLASCYREALRVADELGARSVAFPAVSAGIYGWPLDHAADVAVSTVLATPTTVEDVRFVLFSDDVLAEFERAYIANAR